VTSARPLHAVLDGLDRMDAVAPTATPRIVTSCTVHDSMAWSSRVHVDIPGMLGVPWESRASPSSPKMRMRLVIAGPITLGKVSSLTGGFLMPSSDTPHLHQTVTNPPQSGWNGLNDCTGQRCSRFVYRMVGLHILVA
jgi:hypothetical protein